jgi:hypothetical protein
MKRLLYATNELCRMIAVSTVTIISVTGMVSTASAQSVDTAAEPVEAWQPGAPISLNAQYVETRIDGIDTNWMELVGSGFRGRWHPDGNWQLNSDIRGVSLGFTQRADGQLQMHLSIYQPSDSLPDLDTPSLLAYAASIPAQFPGKKLVDPQLQFVRPPLGSLFFLDSTYRTVSYQLIPENRPGEPVSILDVIGVLRDGRFARLRFQGTERFIRAIEADLSSEIRAFSLEE